MTTNRQTPSNHGDDEQNRPGLDQRPGLDDIPRGRPPATELAANVVRGGLIGLAETVPGVSGGTVALVTGIYTRAIASAKHLTDIPKAVVTRSDVRAEVRQVDWWLLLAVGVGMLLMVFSVAGIMADFVTDQPVYSKALFMGMIAMSVAIPFMELTPGAFPTARSRLSAVVLFVALAVGVIVLTSLPGAEASNPSLILVFFAATIALCASRRIRVVLSAGHRPVCADAHGRRRAKPDIPGRVRPGRFGGIGQLRSSARVVAGELPRSGDGRRCRPAVGIVARTMAVAGREQRAAGRRQRMARCPGIVRHRSCGRRCGRRRAAATGHHAYALTENGRRRSGWCRDYSSSAMSNAHIHRTPARACCEVRTHPPASTRALTDGIATSCDIL